MDGKRTWVAEPARLLLACILPLSVPLFGCVTTQVGAQGQPDGGAAGATGCADIGGPIPGTPAATFDTDVEQFTFDVAPYAGTTLTSLSDPASGTTPPPTLSYDGTDGDPTPGSLEIFAPFSGANQYLGSFHFFGCAALRDWTGKILHARIKILNGTFAEAALLYVGTNTACTKFAGGYGAYTGLAPTSCWQELTLDLGTPTTQAAGYDPTSVFNFGVQFYTGSTGAGAGPVTFLVDSFSVE
jgi:hypothetical protein